ncbi:hypothetical protein Ancab_004329, partial [Ancistrocladus abbreviatus]
MAAFVTPITAEGNKKCYCNPIFMIGELATSQWQTRPMGAYFICPYQEIMCGREEDGEEGDDEIVSSISGGRGSGGWWTKR